MFIVKNYDDDGCRNFKSLAFVVWLCRDVGFLNFLIKGTFTNVVITGMLKGLL